METKTQTRYDRMRHSDPRFIFQLAPIERRMVTDMAIRWYDAKIAQGYNDNNYRKTEHMNSKQKRISSIQLNRLGICGELAAWGILGGVVQWVSAEQSQGVTGSDLILYNRMSIAIKTVARRGLDYLARHPDLGSDFGVLVWPVDIGKAIFEIRGWFTEGDWKMFRTEFQARPDLPLSQRMNWQHMRPMRNWPFEIHNPPRHWGTDAGSVKED